MKIDINKENVIRLSEVSNSIELDPGSGKKIAVIMRDGKVLCGVIEKKEGLNVVSVWYSVEDILPTFIDWGDMIEEEERCNLEHICCDGSERCDFEHICCCDEDFCENSDED